MPKFVIEREIPGAGKLSAGELQAISQKSSGVLNQLGPRISSGFTATSPTTISTAYTSRRTRRWYGNTLRRVDSRPTWFRK